MSGQEIAQKFRNLIEANGGSIRITNFDPGAFQPNFDISAPGYNIPKPTTIAASIFVLFGSPVIVHEVLTTGKDIFHEYMQRNQNLSITISDGTTSVTVKGVSDHNTAIEVFKKAKELKK